MIMDAKMVPQSPSKVCGKCYDEADADYNTRWLPWLECVRPNDHAQEKRVTVIVGDDHEVIEVAEIPSHLSHLSYVDFHVNAQIVLPVKEPIHRKNWSTGSGAMFINDLERYTY